MKDLSICTVIKNEAIYLEEWIKYHKFIGFNHFYIYDNGSTDNPHPIFEKYKNSVTVIEWPLEDWQQKFAYKDYCQKYSKDCNWTAFIDVDEFVVYKDQGKLLDFLNTKRDAVHAHMNWVIFGTNGHLKRPSGLVIENYTASFKVQPKIRVKTICKAKYIDYEKIESPHRFVYKNLGDSSINLKPIVIPSNILSVYHYITKSEEDLIQKYTKGNVWSRETYQKINSRLPRHIAKILEVYDDTDTIDNYMLRYVPYLK